MMNLNRTQISKAASLAAVSTLVILLAGCQSAATPPPDTYVSRIDPVQNQAELEPDSPQKTFSEQQDDNKLVEEPHKNSVDTTTESNAVTSTLHEEEDTKATVQTESDHSAWAAAKPMLHGLAIGDTVTRVEMLFGKESDSYTLDEETETIEVLEFDGFAVGINDDKNVHYIEVYGKDISAGLSGLQIGDQPESALKSLGKPDTQTAFLLTYAAEGAMLKLDLDPEQDEIVSIKLLAAS